MNIDIGNDKFIIVVDDKFSLRDGSGNMLSKEEYSLITPPFDNLLLIEDFDGLCGYMSIDGEIVIPPIYDYIGLFVGDVAPIKIDGLYGFTNKEGVEIIPCIHQESKIGEHGKLFMKKDGLWGAFSTTGEMLHDYCNNIMNIK